MPSAPPRKELVRRHGVIVRVTHWINVAALLVLLMSGLQIFNAHPALYWGQASHFSRPWISMTAQDLGDRMVGVTKIGPVRFDSTGLFGWSGRAGHGEKRGFPAWATIPSYRSLADGRIWHFALAWVFVLNGLVYLSAAILGGHLRNDLWPRLAELKPGHLWREIVEHARLRFPKGEEARRYNILQKLAYLAVILVFLPLMVGTGLTMSPGMDAGLPWLVELFGGRQSARTIHFLSASAIVAFVAVHLAMVVASGTWNNIRSMITGRYAIEVEPPKAEEAAQ
ncbi:cytochrome b/b6 domain-containing protein [Phenylobacterium sp.]|uniref:cytochrome b/b6 domain-containing protein n=1 Tax=Phenylobacterium sp. TaxID=1871053 RepID=UPI0035B25390